MEPRVFIDDRNVLTYRGETTQEERDELTAIATESFNKGLASGYAQGRTKHSQPSDAEHTLGGGQ